MRAYVQFKTKMPSRQTPQMAAMPFGLRAAARAEALGEAAGG